MKEINKEHFNFKSRVGEEFTTNEGFLVRIINYNSYHDCEIIFEDGTLSKKVSLNTLRKGKVLKPLNKIGEKHISNEGFEIEIIEYFGHDKCTIRFNKEEIIENVRYYCIKQGKVKNYIYPQIYGVGYIGKGKYDTYFKVGNVFVYNRWMHILRRCYDDNALNRNPSYKGCSVDERWHNFQNFAQWFEENYSPEYMQLWELDKDILVKGNKNYSPETCEFVLKDVNIIFTNNKQRRGELPIGVIKKKNKFQSIISINLIRINLGSYTTPEEAFQAYKIAKEKYIKEVADKWRGQITERCYQALINYKIEITD